MGGGWLDQSDPILQLVIKNRGSLVPIQIYPKEISMFFADSIRARRGAGAAIAAALDFYFPKCEKLSLTSCVADRRPKRAETPRTQNDALCHFDQREKSAKRSEAQPKNLASIQAPSLRSGQASYSLGMTALPVTSARQSFSNLFFLQSFKFLCIVFTALALTSTTLAGQATRPTAPAAQAIPCTPAAPAPPRQFLSGNRGDAFLLEKKGAFRTFAVAGDVRETAFSDLNNRGDIIGVYVRSDLTGQGFLLERRDRKRLRSSPGQANVGEDVARSVDVEDDGETDESPDEGGTDALLDPGVLTPIDPPGALATAPLHINAKGEIVGIYSDVSETYPIVLPLHGFLLSDGVYTTIDVPGASSTLAFGINDRSQIVGGFFDADGPHGFLLDDGVFTTIDIADSTGTVATGINARGQIVGVYTDAARTAHGFLLDRGVCTTIDVPGAQATQPNDINNRGQIVGQYEAADGQTAHGFLLDRGTLTTIDAPGELRATQVIGINDRGEMVGAREPAAPAVNSGSPGGQP
jgi:probable HAF family extracellular repeat protein